MEEHSYIHIAGDSDWWEGVKRVCTFALALAAFIMDQPEFGWQTEDDFWEDFEKTDLSWDEKLRKLLK